MSQAERRLPDDLDQREPTLAALPGLNGRCWTALRWLNLDESATIANARRALFELAGGEALHVHRTLRKQKGVGHHTADLLCNALGFVIPVRGSGLHCPTCTCPWASDAMLKCVCGFHGPLPDNDPAAGCPRCGALE